MESIIEGYAATIRSLVEESDPHRAFDDDLQSIKEHFDEEADECDKKLDKACLSSSRLQMDAVKDEIRKSAISRMQQSLREITKHIEWAVEQRKLIQANANRRLIGEFSNLIGNFLEQDLRGQFLKLNNLEAIFQGGHRASGRRKLASDFREDLKRGVEPVKNLFKKEVHNFHKELRAVEEGIPSKLNALLKQTKLTEFNLYAELAFKGRQTNRKLFASVFEQLNKLQEKLINEEKELNSRTRANLEANLERSCTLISAKFDEFQRNHQRFLADATEQKADFDKELSTYDEKCKRQIRSLFDDIERTTLSFDDLAVKSINSKFDSDLEDAWFKFFQQTKNRTHSQSLDFELRYLDLISLQGDLEQRSEQALGHIFHLSTEKVTTDSRKSSLKVEPESTEVSVQYEEETLSQF